jgi:hypothetical protein
MLGSKDIGYVDSTYASARRFHPGVVISRLLSGAFAIMQ